MTPDQKKKISRIAVAGTFIMALTCTMKITAFHLNQPVIAQWINVIMNAIIIWGCYELGKLAQLSRSHSLLCGTAMLGYILYTCILLFSDHQSGEGVSMSVLCFFFLTLLMSVWFFIDLVLRDLNETKKDLEELEREIGN